MKRFLLCAALLAASCAQRTRVQVTITSDARGHLDRLRFLVSGDSDEYEEDRDVDLEPGGVERIVYYPRNEQSAPVMIVDGYRNVRRVARGATQGLALLSGAVLDVDITLSALVTQAATATFSPTAPVDVTEDFFALSETRVADGETLTIDTEQVEVRGKANYETRIEQGVYIVSFGDLNVRAGGTLRVLGRLPVAIVSSGQITIQGVLRAQDCERGAGGGQGRGGDGGGNGDGGGGGGAGHGGLGAVGGAPRENNTGSGSAGSRYPMDDSFVLATGSVGGDGGVKNARGGRGGGAIQLVANNSITIGDANQTSGVNVGGCGGSAGGSNGGGAGGGSGGAILIESPSVNIAAQGWVSANGGGGGGGGNGQGSKHADDGEDGRLDRVANAGVGYDGSKGGDGGKGSFSSMLDGEAGKAGDNSSPGGGGGGGAGRIRILTLSGMVGGGVTHISPSGTALSVGTIAAK